MNKDTYLYLNTVKELGSFSRAAEKLSISQPAISAQIKKIENKYGISIFDRSTQPLELTEQGRVFLTYLTKQEKLTAEMKSQLSQMNTLERGTVNIGGSSAFNFVYVPEVVKDFHSKYPGVKLNIIEDTMPGLVQRARNGEIEMFISSPMGRQEGIKFEKLLSTNVYLCVPNDDPINEKLKEYAIYFEEIDGDMRNNSTVFHNEVSLTEFTNIPFITLEQDKHLGKLLAKLMKEYKINKEANIVADQSLTSYIMTSKGVGLSLMSGIDIKNIYVENRPCYYIVDKKYCKREMYIATRKDKKLSLAASEFIKIFKSSVMALK